VRRNLPLSFLPPPPPPPLSLVLCPSLSSAFVPCPSLSFILSLFLSLSFSLCLSLFCFFFFSLSMSPPFFSCLVAVACLLFRRPRSVAAGHGYFVMVPGVCPPNHRPRCCKTTCDWKQEAKEGGVDGVSTVRDSSYS
jgi:hypothetical protein